MVARLVRDQKVVGSSPVTSTTKKASDIPRLLFLYSKVIRNLRGGKAKFFRRRSEGSTSDKTADTRCFPCASAQGASPVTSTTKKASDIPRLFFVFQSDTGLEGRQGEILSPQVGGLYLRQNSGHPLFSVRVRSRRKSRHLNHKKGKRYKLSLAFFCHKISGQDYG